MAKKGKLTPMMQQYMQIKEENKDCILFYRLGDFYEMFFDDALTASKELEITLTGKIACLEEIAYLNHWITKDQLLTDIEPLKKNQYGQYLMDVMAGKFLDK